MSRKRKIPEDLGKKLMDSAQSFVTSFDTLRMEDIAKASGVPRATLYYYFDGKSEILTYLMYELLAIFSEQVDEVVRSEKDTRSRLEAVIRSQVELVASSPASAQVILSNLGQIGNLPDLAEEVDRSFVEPIRQVLDDGVRLGDVGTIDVGAASTTVFAAMSVAAIRSVVQGEVHVDQLVEGLMGVLWNGIGARTSDTSSPDEAIADPYRTAAAKFYGN